MSDETYGRVIVEGEFENGLACCECGKQLEPGDRYATRLLAMTHFMGEPTTVAEIICLECALGAGTEER